MLDLVAREAPDRVNKRASWADLAQTSARFGSIQANGRCAMLGPSRVGLRECGTSGEQSSSERGHNYSRQNDTSPASSSHCSNTWRRSKGGLRLWDAARLARPGQRAPRSATLGAASQCRRAASMAFRSDWNLNERASAGRARLFWHRPAELRSGAPKEAEEAKEEARKRSKKKKMIMALPGPVPLRRRGSGRPGARRKKRPEQFEKIDTRRGGRPMRSVCGGLAPGELWPAGARVAFCIASRALRSTCAPAQANRLCFSHSLLLLLLLLRRRRRQRLSSPRRPRAALIASGNHFARAQEKKDEDALAAPANSFECANLPELRLAERRDESVASACDRNMMNCLSTSRAAQQTCWTNLAPSSRCKRRALAEQVAWTQPGLRRRRRRRSSGAKLGGLGERQANLNWRRNFLLALLLVWLALALAPLRASARPWAAAARRRQLQSVRLNSNSHWSNGAHNEHRRQASQIDYLAPATWAPGASKLEPVRLVNKWPPTIGARPRLHNLAAASEFDWGRSEEGRAQRWPRPGRTKSAARRRRRRRTAEGQQAAEAEVGPHKRPSGVWRLGGWPARCWMANTNLAPTQWRPALDNGRQLFGPTKREAGEQLGWTGCKKYCHFEWTTGELVCCLLCPAAKSAAQGEFCFPLAGRKLGAGGHDSARGQGALARSLARSLVGWLAARTSSLAFEAPSWQPNGRQADLASQATGAAFCTPTASRAKFNYFGRPHVGQTNGPPPPPLAARRQPEITSKLADRSLARGRRGRALVWPCAKLCIEN